MEELSPVPTPPPPNRLLPVDMTCSSNESHAKIAPHTMKNGNNTGALSVIHCGLALSTIVPLLTYIGRLEH